jgi:hypothetical protein
MNQPPAQHPKLTGDEVRERLAFARRREEELVALNGGDLAGADPQYRQQLTQEFFFHLVGAIEVLAQLANETRGVGFDAETATIPAVKEKIPSGDPLREALDGLYAAVRRNPTPKDPYSDEGYVFRIWNYRHQVTHRRRQPFLFKIGVGTAIDFGPGLRGRWRELKHRLRPDPHTRAPGPSAHFILDPREPPDIRTASAYSVYEELERMLALVSEGCERALAVA